jgi:hypothetical protein
MRVGCGWVGLKPFSKKARAIGVSAGFEPSSAGSRPSIAD